jgi:hypothetical protein
MRTTLIFRGAVWSRLLSLAAEAPCEHAVTLKIEGVAP